MAGTGVNYVVASSAVAGSQITMTMHTCTYGGANTITITATNGTVACDLIVEGDLDGFLEFPFADMDTMKGILQPTELKDMQIQLTEGAAGGVTALIAEKLYTN